MPECRKRHAAPGMAGTIYGASTYKSRGRVVTTGVLHISRAANRNVKVIRARVALTVFVALAVLHTWPLSGRPATLSLNHNADAQQAAWTVSWIARTLPRDPANLFNGNIFAPEPRTLAYSDPLFVPALLVAPVRWLGGSPVLAFNLSLLAGLALTAWAAWFVVARWTGNGFAALTAGALASFNANALTRLPHLMAAHVWGMVLTMYFADRLVDSSRATSWRAAAGLTSIVALTAATSVYWLAMSGIIVGVVLVVALALRRWRQALVIAASAALGGVLALPILWPYIQLASTGARRPLSAAAQFAATPAAYVTSLSHVHRGWTSPLFKDELNVIFAGATAITLAIVGVTIALQRRGEMRRRIIVVTVVGTIGAVLSLGPATIVYRWLYDWFTPLQGLRAAVRFSYLYLLAVSLAAGFGLAWIAGRATSRRASQAIGIAALVLVTVEAALFPIKTTPFDGVPRIYQLVARAPDPVMLVEVPFYPPQAVHENGEYQLNATAHWRPLMNGTSGFTPASYRRRADSFWFFPRDWAIDAIKKEGATHVMVHLPRFGNEAEEVMRVLDARSDLHLLSSDAGGRRLYEIR